MLTWGKGMGGDMPMAGVTYRADMEEALREGSQPTHLRRQRHGLRGRMTNIDLITDPELDLIGRAAALGEEIKGLFTDAMPNVPCIGDVRGNGLMVGIEVVADRKTKEPLAGEKVGEIAMKLLNARHPHDPLRAARQRLPLHAAAHGPARVRAEGDATS